MIHLRPRNRTARRIADDALDDVRGLAFNDCCASFAPGWEVGSGDQADPCPWKSDLTLCWNTCYWMGQVPDASSYGTWMDSCGNINSDWRNLCTVPDNG